MADIMGTEGSDFLVGRDEPDNLYGRGGDDILVGGIADRLFGEEGNDTLHVEYGTAFAAGGLGLDRLVLGSVGEGDYAIELFTIIVPDESGRTGRIMLKGTEVEVIAFSGIDQFTLIGGNSGDTLTTFEGDDVIATRAGDDWVFTQGGDDLVAGGLGDDNLDGGDGIDTLSYADAAGSVSIDLQMGFVSGADGNDAVFNFENVIGSNFADVVTGDALANALSGGDGDDILMGRGSGDLLSGGLGRDTFRFVSPSDSAPADADLITDFSGRFDYELNTRGGLRRVQGERDSIDLSAIDADITRDGDQAFSLRKAFTGRPGQLVESYDAASNVTSLLMDADGDQITDMTIVFAGEVRFVASDFIF